nr:neuroblast differentiation-associated protein AHNAK [Misgurnus anguillicaudatus]
MDSDREDSHDHPEAKDSPVNNKRRSPPSDRPPFGPHLTHHHNISTDEQDSPERIIQKEKLHAELKRVLSEKRSHLRETHSTLTDMDENSKKDSKNEEEKDRHLSEFVEVVVETQPEFGASGYSVVGGGEQGIFIKEVLKDSPAAKHLSLQKGDQLLSAKVYFDNVKYEDALKILQCAEPYKVSFLLKRTVPGGDISIHPVAQNLELRGPKVKMQRMNVKSVKPFKAKRKRGGRFGLKRLKENKNAKAELDIEDSPGRSDFGPVDVEFDFPKIKMRKGVKGTVDGSGQLEGLTASTRNKRNIRFPKMKVKDASVGEGNVNIDVSAYEGCAESSGAKLKDKGKGPKLGMNLPKIKTSKLDVQSSNGNFEVKEPKAQIKLPSTESDLSVGDEVDGYMVKDPKISLPKLDIAVPKTETSDVNISLPKLDVSLPKVTSKNIDTEGHASTGVKLEMPKLDIETSLDIEGHSGIGGKFNMPKVSVSPPTVKLLEKDNTKGSEVTAGKFGMPSVEMSLPEGKAEGNVEVVYPSGKIGKFKLSGADAFLPKTKSAQGDISFEGPDMKRFSTPSVEISLPKVKGTSEVDVNKHLEKTGEFDVPKLDMNVPNIESTKREIHIEAKTRRKFQIPQVDLSLPRIKAKKVEINVEGPDIKSGKICMPSRDISLSGGGVGADVDVKGKGGKVEVPKIDVSLPELKSPGGEINVEGPDIKGGKFHMPSLDISLPKGGAGADVDVKGKGGKFEMPKIDVSLPKLKSPSGEINVEGPDIKGGKFHMPSLDISLPKGAAGADIDVKGKGGKFEMPKLDVSLPKLKSPSGEINVEGPDIKGGKFHMPSLDISLPKGGAGADVDVKGKGGKFEMPKIDVSLPKLKSPEAEINVEGPDIKGGKFHMPSLDISLPKGGAGADIDVKGKGGKFEMPKLDVSLPKLKSPSGEINVEGPDIKGGKFHMPSLDISLPKGGAGADVDVKGKGGKFEMPKIDVSLPKLKSPEAEINVEGPDIKGGKFHMPSLDISLPKGGAGADVDVKGKGGKFEMPKVDVSLPKLKSPSGEINVEGPDIKGGKFHMPSLDISLPKGGAGADVDVKGKGGKFEMPKIDVSLPKLKLPEAEINVEGPDIKGGKFHMPSLDISLPKGGAGADVDVKGGKFEMPKIDVSLPKLKSPEAEINVEGPDIKGGKFHMPSLDISLPKGGAGADVDVKGKGGKFEMPKIDVSLPKLKSPSGEINVEGPDIKGGKFHMPSLDISLPKGGAGADVDVKGKGGKFEMPKIDVSLPKLKSPEAEINVEGPDIKGGKFHMPSLDISLPKGGAGADVDVKGGKFEMPKIDVSLPKLKSPSGEINVEGPDIKGGKFEMPKIDVSLPKLKSPSGEINVEGPDIKGGKFHMPSLDISLPKGGAGADVDVKGKGGKFEMPKIDISLPKLKSPEAEINVEGPDIKGGKFHMPSLDISLPKGGAGADVDVKGGKFEMPKIDVSLPKLKSPSGEINVEGPDIKGGKFHMPSLDISLPKGGAGADVDVKGKGGKFEMPKIDVSLPKLKSPSGEINVEGPDIKGGKFHMPSLDISLPKGGAGADVDVKGKGGKFEMPKIDISLPKLKSPEAEINVEGPDIKGGKFHMPSLDISLPKGGAGADVDVKGGKFEMPKIDVSLPKLKSPSGEINVEGPDIKGGKFHMPSLDISLPKGGAGADVDVKGKGGKFEMPKIDVSLPKLKSPSGEINVEGPDIKGGKFHMPSLDISLPKGGAGADVDVKGKGGKFEMPKIDVSLPKLKSPEAEINVEGPDIKGGKFHMPSLDISLPKGGAGADIDVKGKGGKFEMPKIDVSLPKLKSPEAEINVEGPDIKGGKFHVPSLDISLPKGGAGADVDVKGKGGKFEMPKVDVSLPKLKSPSGEINVEGPDIKGGKFHMPSLDISLPKGGAGADVDVKGKGGKFEMPKIDVSLPKLKSPEAEINVEGPDIKGGKFHMPSLDISLPKGGAGADVDVKGGKFEMPKIDVSLPKLKSPSGEINVEGPDIKGGKFHMPSLDISLPKGGAGADVDVKGGKFEMPKIDVSLPKLKSPSGEINVEGPDIKGGKFHMPSLDISLPKGGAGADVDVKGKGGKFEMPKVDVSLPKLKSPSGEINVEGPDIKGGKFHMPSLDISLPKGGAGADVDVKGKGGKFEMPKIDVSLPKLKSPEAEINVEGPDIKGGKFHMPSLDISLPKGGAGADVDVKGKGGKFEMPKLDVSLPKLKSPGAEINVEGPDIKGGKFHMPSLDISLPKGGAGADVDVKGKGGKFEMPKIDISLPKLKSPEAEVNVEGPDIKGGKFHMPSLDISLPKGGAGADVDVKGGKFEMPKIDVSLPKLKSPSGEINVEGPDIKGGKFHMPSLDISLPKGGAGADVDVKGKGGKFEMPKIDVSLPKLKSPEAEINVEGPDIKGGKFHMPSLDISLPKGGAGADIDVKGKGGKFEMPKIDVSLPKLKSPSGEINVEGPDIKGGKFHMPSLDISLPKGGAGADVDVKGKGGKFEMPKIDVSLPKLKSPGAEINVEGPDIKGGKFHMPSLDISLPKGGAGADVDVKGKGGKFEMPKVDVSLPKLKSPSGEINVEGPDIKGGKFHMPSLDISLPKGGAGADVDGKGKGGKFEMPKIDVSLPKLKSPSGEINVEGPDIKGGKFHMPSLDISLPKGGAGADVDVKGKGGKFEMPKIDVSLPKLKSPEAEINVEGPDIKGGKFHMPSLDISLPKGGAGAVVDVKGKGGKFEMPKLDVSLPKLKSPGAEINVEGPDIKGGKFHMPSLDISLPKGGAGADVDVKGKGGKFEMPKIDISLPKLKSPEAEVNVEGPDIKGGKFHMPSLDISLPKGGAGADVDVKGGKFEMPKIDVSLPKLKSPSGEINVEGPDIKGGKFHMPSLDISLPKGGAGADVDVKGKGGKFEMPKVDISLPKLKSPSGEINVEGPDIKGGKFHMPSLDISLPKGGAGADVDVKGKGGKFEMPKVDISLPKLKSPSGEINVEGPDIKGGKFHMPSLDISLPKGGAGADVDVKGGKFEMPKIDISLPKLKSPSDEINVEGPDIKGGKFHMPSLDISLPKGGAGADVDVKGKGGKFEMPKIDVSLPKLKSPEAEINVEGPDIKGGKFHMPSLDISLPKGGAGADVDVKGKGGKFEMPKVDVSLPKLKSPSGEINVEGPDIKGGKFHMPSLDISLPKGGAGADVDVKGGKFEMPKIDVSLPKLKSPSGEINVEGPDIKGGKFHMPSLDISLPKGGAGADVDVKGKGGKFEMPKIDVSLPKLKSPEAEVNVEGPNIKGGKFHMPSLDISLPKGGAGVDVDVKGGKFEMPKIDVSLPKLKSPSGEINVEGPDIKGGKFHMPSLDISLPKGGAGADIDVKGKGGKFEMPKLDVSLPTVDISAPKVDLDFTLPKGKGNDRENIELLKAEGGRPSSGASFDIPDVYVKMPKMLPKFGKKLNSGDSGSANLEMERKLPSVDVDGKMKKTKTKMPDMDMSLDIRNKGKVKMPTVEISLPTTKIPECEVLLPKGEVDVSEADIKSYEGSLKIPKMPNVDISVPKVDLDVSLPRVKLDESMDSTSSDLHIESSSGTVKFPHIKIPKVDISIPHGKTEDINTDANLPKTKTTDTEISTPKKMTSPKIPDIDFDIETVQVDTNNEDVKRQAAKVKIQKFGIPLPSLSSPEANLTSSQVKGHSVPLDYKVEYESPTMPKVRKAVFVMVTPETQSADVAGSEASTELKYDGVKLTKFKMKPSFSKSQSNEKGKSISGGEEEVETQKKTKTSMLKLPKVTLSPGKTGSFEVTPSGSDDRTSQPLNGNKDDNTKLVKLKFPKVEFFSPYTGEKEKMETATKLRKEDGKESKSGKTLFPGVKKKTGKDEDELREGGVLVYSKARTEMLEEHERCEEREETTWFKVPKVTLSPHSTGLLHVTPDESPKGSKTSLSCSGEEAIGGFYVKMPSVEFSTHEMSSEQLVTETTVVTKTTTYTETKSSSTKL